MATTTPNFGWAVPTSTDLVKDGALAIETLGDSIDASLVDLKGGTTGQVLAKATNTDMDFSWVAQDDSNAIQNAIVDAKGDLIAATANDTPARLAVGANDTMLVGDSTAATGLSYKSAATLYPWATWSPTYTSLTVGNGTVTARYQQIGKLVTVYYKLVFGSTTSVSAYPQISLPVTNARTNYFNGVSHIEDSGVAAYTGFCYMESNDRFQVLTQLVNGTYSLAQFITASTIPFTWTTNDFFIASFSYEAA